MPVTFQCKNLNDLIIKKVIFKIKIKGGRSDSGMSL